jgi:putative hemolysin
MEYVLLGVLLLMSGLFSGSETALFSIGKVAQNRLRQSERPTEILIVGLLERPRNLLIAVLLGNELTNIALSVVNAGITSRFLSDRSLLE